MRQSLNTDHSGIKFLVDLYQYCHFLPLLAVYLSVWSPILNRALGLDLPDEKVVGGLQYVFFLVPHKSAKLRLEVLLNSLESGDFHTEAFQKTAAGVKQKTDRMAKILKGMLSYARDGSKDPATIVNISSLVKDVIDYTHHKLNKASVVVTSNLPEYAPVECRETEISQVLVNLILNSCDAIVNLESKWINLSVKDTKDTVMISITDSGSGIDKEKAAKIMKPFYTTKAAGKGTGLGLSISQTIIENHNGAMTIDFLSPNTKFDISLPKKLAV